MFNYFVRRFLLIIPTFLVCTMVVYGILEVTPGGPFERAIKQAEQGILMSGEGGGGGSSTTGQVEIPDAAKEELRRYYNLDKPLPTRYVLWLGNILQGDFGESYVHGDPVLDVIVRRFPVSIYFGLIGFTLAYMVSVPLGILKALKHGTKFDLLSSALVFIGYSIPGWALGAVLLVIFAGQLDWFPLGGFRSDDWEYLGTFEKIVDQVYHTILPLIAYMVGGFATLTILTKNSLLENLGQDYVRTAFAKGLTEKKVVFVHAMRNSMIPLATGLGHALSLVLAGSLLIEKTFNIDGFGYLGFRSAVERDYTVVMGVLVIAVVIQLLGNIFSDMLYAIIDPRIRFS